MKAGETLLTIIPRDTSGECVLPICFALGCAGLEGQVLQKGTFCRDTPRAPLNHNLQLPPGPLGLLVSGEEQVRGAVVILVGIMKPGQQEVGAFDTVGPGWDVCGTERSTWMPLGTPLTAVTNRPGQQQTGKDVISRDSPGHFSCEAVVTPQVNHGDFSEDSRG